MMGPRSRKNHDALEIVMKIIGEQKTESFWIILVSFPQKIYKVSNSPVNQVSMNTYEYP